MHFVLLCLDILRMHSTMNIKAQLHVLAISVGPLQVVHEELINKLYQRVWGVYVYYY